MTKTLATAASSYASASDILARVDQRICADLCSDTGVRITSGALATNTNFLEAIQDACAMIEAAAFRGKRYSVDDLSAVAASTGVAQGLLFRLIARLTVVCLYERRTDLQMQEPWIYKQALEDLERLKNGDDVFPFLETEEAGLPSSTIETPADVEARGGITFIASRYFGTRANRRPVRGGG